MKKTGIELFESADINVNGCPLMMQSIEEMHDEALEMNYGPTRMPRFIAHVDYKEMVSFRKLTEVPAHMLCLAEMELRAR